MVTATHRYRVAKHARFRVLDNEGIFIIQNSGEVLAVNHTAAQVVSWLGETEIGGVTERFAQAHGLEAEQATLDVQQIVDELVHAGALEATPA